MNDWININDLLIPDFYGKKIMIKTGLSGIFAASLELTMGSNIFYKKNYLRKYSLKKILNYEEKR